MVGGSADISVGFCCVTYHPKTQWLHITILFTYDNMSDLGHLFWSGPGWPEMEDLEWLCSCIQGLWQNDLSDFTWSHPQESSPWIHHMEIKGSQRAMRVQTPMPKHLSSLFLLYTSKCPISHSKSPGQAHTQYERRPQGGGHREV